MITKQNESRNNCFECSRAICMIWIVCILHCSEYIRDCPWRFDDPLFIDITYGVVATFVFLSGYFIGKKSFAERQSIKRFYIRRLKGLYIPFFISCTIMLAMHYIWGTVYILSVKQYFLSLVGLSMLIPPAPSTLWFVVFMLQCYLVAPFVVGYKNRVFACIIWYSCVILIHSMVKPIWGIEPDSRILLLLPVFLLGLCLPERIPEVISLVSIFMLIGIIAILESIGVHYDSSCRYALIGCLVALFIELGILLARNPLLARMGGVLGEISMPAYLFHRQYYYIVVNRLLGETSVLIMYAFVVPLYFAILYLIKKWIPFHISRRKTICNNHNV